MTLPRAWRDHQAIRACRPRAATDAPALIPDSKVGQLDHLLHHCGVLEVIDAELEGRPGPEGLPLRTVLVALMLALHYHASATLADAGRVLLDELQPRAKHWLAVPDLEPGDDHGRIAFSRRIYRAFDRLTTALDPQRCDRRSGLPQNLADAHAATWQDTDPEHERRRKVLQEISDRLVLISVRLAMRHGAFKHWNGDVGADTTAVPAWHKPSNTFRELGSIETTGGFHYSAGDTTGTFGHSATILVAASRRHPTSHPHAGQRTSRHPQLALGLVLDTGGKRPGPNAVHTLHALAPLGLPIGLLAADRAYTDQTTEHFQLHARRAGYLLALDYKQDQRGIQGTHHGIPLIDGTLACPNTPTALANATTGLDDRTIHRLDPELAARIAAREPYFLKRKQGPDPQGTVRLQCPAAGPSPSVTCPRFNRLHPHPTDPATVVDLTNPRALAAHPAGKPAVQITPAERFNPPPKQNLPLICQQPTITIKPGELGKLDKFRQDRHYLSPDWHDAYKPIRAHNEGINGRAKGHRIDLAEPKRRLAHGRAAQAVLVALMICMLNLQILDDWHRTTGEPLPNTDLSSTPPSEEPSASGPTPNGIPPPPS